ncbi:hypothetical protein EYC80_003357 [Monilinia laxa]|uniref:Malonyl-CoA:ACP transacylase (MAT) domain-containing protein n=1 Tax=Monilinia laxa TaxID=61186 RepID=A0A5N6KDL3_MONLA|nr:hypothetical protein EYC80_003357 [Monilinia laxa]
MQQLAAWNLICGELGAAYASVTLTSAKAIIAASDRGLVTQEQTRPGAMAAVGLGREDGATYLDDEVSVACENSPESATLSGDAEKVDTVIEKIKAHHPDVFARRLRVEMTYHSAMPREVNWVIAHMTEVGAKYELLLEPHITSSSPQVPFYSTVLKKVINDTGSLNAAYWRKNL